jgi:arabinofuranan 3-O-arabinosyltransferase
MACFVLCVAQLVYLAASFVLHQWLIDPQGRGIPTDFVNVWAAGKLVLSGFPDWAYVWKVHKEIENAAVGYNFGGYYGWHYPPPFLAVASVLALLPYVVAYFAWIAITLPVYVATIRWIVGEKIGTMLAFAFPAVLANAMVGQNGFLTASLVGGALGFLEKQPVLSGVCLGLLTYKPQFGILFPLALVAARKWTVFFVAALVALAMAFLSWLAFGFASWEAFFHWLPITSKTFLSEGQANFGKLQSLYGLVRALHGSEPLAWALQILLSAASAAAVCFFWYRKKPYALQAALLGTCALLATPYVYLYDVVILAVPVAFLVRAALKTGFLPGEQGWLLAAAILIFGFPFVQFPVGFLAILIVAALVLRRLVLTK